MDFVNENYSRTPEDLIHPFYSPIYTPLEDLTLLKNHFLVYGEFDYVRRTIEAFKDKLTLAGVAHQCLVLENQGHSTMTMLAKKDSVFTPKQK